jgi:hypothetical protein
MYPPEVLGDVAAVSWSDTPSRRGRRLSRWASLNLRVRTSCICDTFMLLFVDNNRLLMILGDAVMLHQMNAVHMAIRNVS